MIHPTQRERFEVDARGLRTARIVTLITPQGEPRADASTGTGTVDMTRYLQWLRDNGYNLGNLRVQ